MQNYKIQFPKVNRVEDVDETGRAYVKWDNKDYDVSIEIQDDGKTLKVVIIYPTIKNYNNRSKNKQSVKLKSLNYANVYRKIRRWIGYEKGGRSIC